MPDLGPLHPQIVHFVVALGFLGVIVRIVSLLGKPAWTKGAGTFLLLVAAGASVLAVESGDEAHGPAERIPGAREVVHEHEELGEQTRTLFLVIGALEIGALALYRKEKVRRGVFAVSALVGVYTCWVLYHTARHGGEIVYQHAGGVGTRSGDPADVRRLLVAGLYHQARTARDEGRLDEAARLTEEMQRQAPNDVSVALLAIESTLNDRGDAHTARLKIEALQVLPDNAGMIVQRGLLLAETYRRLGHADSARSVLRALAQEFPESRAVREAMEGG